MPPNDPNDRNELDEISEAAQEALRREHRGKVWTTIGGLLLVVDVLLWTFVPKDLQAGRHSVLTLAVVFAAAGFLMIVAGMRWRGQA